MSKARVLMAIGRLVGGLIIFAAFAAVLLAATGRGAVETPRRMPPRAVEAAPTSQRDTCLHREWSGTLGAYLTVEVRPRAGGTLRRRLYREGSFVRKGDVLFEIDPCGSGAALDPAGGDGWAKVDSPIDGIVGGARARVGDPVDARTALTTVSTVDWIKVFFQASRQEYEAWTKRPDPVDQWPAGHPGHQALFELFPVDGAPYAHHGHLLPAGRGAETAAGTIALIAVFPNPDHLLRPGQHARLRAPVDAGGTHPGVIEAGLTPPDRMAVGGSRSAWSVR